MQVEVPDRVPEERHGDQLPGSARHPRARRGEASTPHGLPV